MSLKLSALCIASWIEALKSDAGGCSGVSFTPYAKFVMLRAVKFHFSLLIRSVVPKSLSQVKLWTQNY